MRITPLQFLETINDWTQGLGSGSCIDALYIDIKKAFDTVSHVKLIEVLESIGIAGNLPSWLRSYLTDRKQYVALADCHSGISEVTSGVPQGSILGPKLFLTFIDDMSNTLPVLFAKLFADDAKLYTFLDRCKNIDEIRLDLDLMAEWFDTRQALLNFSFS